MINLICFIIFITYLAICFYLGYMFLKDRKIFNIVIIDSITTDLYHLRDTLECFGILNPILDKTINTDSEMEMEMEMKIEIENNKKQIEILSGIYKIFKTINENNIPDTNLFLAEYEMFNWMLECIIRDYQNISSLPGNFYYQMEKTYLANRNTYNRDIYPDDVDILNYLENETPQLLSMFKYIQEQKPTIREFQSIFLITLFQNIEKYIIDLFETYPELINR